MYYTYARGRFIPGPEIPGVEVLPEWPDGATLEGWLAPFCGAPSQTIEPTYGVEVIFFNIDPATELTTARGVVVYVEPVHDCGFVVHIPDRPDLLAFMRELEPMLRVGRMMEEIDREEEEPRQ